MKFVYNLRKISFKFRDWKKQGEEEDETDVRKRK